MEDKRISGKCTDKIIGVLNRGIGCSN